MRRLIVACVTPVVASLTMVGSASAQSGVKICIPEAHKKAILSPNECTNTKIRYKVLELGKEGKEGPEGRIPFSSEELALIENVLAHIKFITNGIDGKPTSQFSGVNMQIVNGEGKTATDNGEGNLAIGYDFADKQQEGSHNLVLGELQTFTSYGGIIAGEFNTVTGPYSSVTGGAGNTASGANASVSGGEFNQVTGAGASVSGGFGNTASGELASVSGGFATTARGFDSSVAGGEENIAANTHSSVSGGFENIPSGANAWDGGGRANRAIGTDSAIFGGSGLAAKGEFEAIP